MAGNSTPFQYHTYNIQEKKTWLRNPWIGSRKICRNLWLVHVVPLVTRVSCEMSHHPSLWIKTKTRLNGGALWAFNELIIVSPSTSLTLIMASTIPDLGRRHMAHVFFAVKKLVENYDSAGVFHRNQRIQKYYLYNHVGFQIASYVGWNRRLQHMVFCTSSVCWNIASYPCKYPRSSGWMVATPCSLLRSTVYVYIYIYTVYICADNQISSYTIIDNIMCKYLSIYTYVKKYVCIYIYTS